MNATFILRGEAVAHRLYAVLKANWRAMAEQGKPLAVTLTEAKSKRSLEQNKLLHALIADIAATAWVDGRQYSPEVWKEQIRRRFIGTEEMTLPDGTRVERGISTTTLDVGQCADLITRVQQWAIEELGCEIA